MLLRRLEAYGFKSFAEKTELEFGQGVTAIVGPNGSGKSNISDAIRWALGEQSLRTLRGAKMEDVIFAGSANRRALGVAEVSLIFDNSDGKLPLDYNEVTITRRVFRSGESEYFINKTACRLKDIHEMLADTGLGRDSMTVIGQNKVDEILSSKPEERRLLFEEAAGITKYKHRKRDALRKMEDTEQNLTRVQDITAELQSQLEPLQESAARTTQYNQLTTELKACQATILLERLEKAEKMVESANLEQIQLTDRNIAINTRLASVDNEKDLVTLQIAQADEQISDNDRKIQDVTNEIERIDSRNGVLSERIEQSLKAKARIEDEFTRIANEQQSAAEKHIGLQNSLSEKQQQFAAINMLLAEKNNKNELMLTRIREFEQQVELGKEQTFDHLQQLVNERNNFRMLERDLSALTARESNLAKEHAEYLDQKEEFNTKIKHLRAECDNLTSQRSDLERQLKDARQTRTSLEREMTKLLEQKQQLSNKLNETSSRLNVLTSMQHELEGFGRAIKGILKAQSSWRSGICGAVAQLLTVPDKYVNAIEVALGGAQQHLVTDTDQTAKQAIAFLKNQNLGRATFLPLNTIRIVKPREIEVLAASSNGALGFATDVIEVAERYRPVVNYLLGRVIIARTIDDALSIARNSGFSVKIVTLDGELINPGGSLTGGSMGRKEASFIARNNEIDILKQSLVSLKEQQDDLDRHRNTIDADINNINSQLTCREADYQGTDLRQAEIAIHLDKARADIERCNLAIKTISNEMSECRNDFLVCQQKIEQSRLAIISLENMESSHKSKVADWQNELKAMKEEQQTLSDEVTDAKIKISVFNQEIAATRSTCEQVEQLKTSLKNQISRLQSEKIQIEHENEQAQGELILLSERKKSLQENKAQLTEMRQEYYAAKMELLATMQKLEKEMKDLRKQSAETQSKLHEIELLITKYSYEAANCSEQITGQLAMNIDEARELKQSGSIEQILKSVAELERQIAALGPINPAAVDEYNRVQERYNFLQEQIGDLTQARDYLKSVIRDMDITMSRQFNTAFKAINEYFGDVFVRLFGGGRAELVLIEPNNILETGIDIIVQPPGKKLQNLALLSGGERSFTVIALLFAILTYRPAPFCVVDEIDAALDEANVQRFSEFLRDYAQNTQFIVVTHRKGTMEAASVLHGVTMEDSGISRLVSVKFMDKAG